MVCKLSIAPQVGYDPQGHQTHRAARQGTVAERTGSSLHLQGRLSGSIVFKVQTVSLTLFAALAARRSLITLLQ